MPGIDKTAVAAAFGRAARHYDQYAELQRHSGDALFARLSQRRASRVLDAGCGTGWYSRVWQARGSQVWALDLCPEMLAIGRQTAAASRYIQADIESIPLANGSVDLAWSNLAVQWCSDIQRALAELYRVTKPGGCIAFTTLAEGSLHELHTAWQGVDKRQVINTFLSEDKIAEGCKSWRTRLQSQTITQLFPDVLSAMRSLKGVGATHLHQGRHSGLTTRRHIQQLSQAWPQQAGQYPLSWQIVSGVIERDS